MGTYIITIPESSWGFSNLFPDVYVPDERDPAFPLERVTNCANCRYLEGVSGFDPDSGDCMLKNMPVPLDSYCPEGKEL